MRFDLRPLQKSELELSALTRLCCGPLTGGWARVRLAVGRQIGAPCAGGYGVATLALTSSSLPQHGMPPSPPSVSSHVSLYLHPPPRGANPGGMRSKESSPSRATHGLRAWRVVGGRTRREAALQSALCTTLGSLERQHFTPARWGVSLLHAGGAVCASDGSRAYVEYRLLCAPAEPAVARLLNVSDSAADGCAWVAWFASAHACPLMPAATQPEGQGGARFWDDALGAASALAISPEMVRTGQPIAALAEHEQARQEGRPPAHRASNPWSWLGGSSALQQLTAICVPGGTRTCQCGSMAYTQSHPHAPIKDMVGASDAPPHRGHVIGASFCARGLDRFFWSPCFCFS